MTDTTLPPTSDLEFVTMSVGDTHLGVPVMQVRDVLDTPVIYRVPLAPPEILGSINLRGRIVTAIDLRARLDLPRRPEGARCMCVIVERSSGAATEPYALLVDEVGDVLSMPASAYEANPVTLAERWRALCRGLYRREASLLIVLDVDTLLDIPAAKDAA
ncbi:Chemotaxis protein cheW [uncultured Defluviicoccus sp.]|uniref:Chemotaxis protein cheW n=1 Tax=metagenome TaxID=256318 RepID=A0A380T867_9ZZZZ|nr:Chemotaxis protein cheW [uncultured Defluviicoccus sp.]